MSWFRRFLIWLGIIKPASWFPFEWGITDRQSALRSLFPTLKGTFQRPSAPVARPYRRSRPRYKGRPMFRYKRLPRFHAVDVASGPDSMVVTFNNGMVWEFT